MNNLSEAGPRAGRLIVLTGPAGVGKGTVEALSLIHI